VRLAHSTLHYITVQYITSQYITLYEAEAFGQMESLVHSTLHYSTLQYITLHYTRPRRSDRRRASRTWLVSGVVHAAPSAPRQPIV